MQCVTSPEHLHARDGAFGHASEHLEKVSMRLTIITWYCIYGNDLLTNLGEALQFRSRVILVFLLPVNIIVKVVKMSILIFVIYLYAIVTLIMVMLIKN